MHIAVPVTQSGVVAPGWGRAQHVAMAEVSNGEIAGWRVFDVNWHALHDEGTEGAHHARIVRFLLDNEIDGVVVEHMGEGMTRMLATMGIPVSLGAEGDARSAVLVMGRQFSTATDA